MSDERRIDEVTGTETTGHEWDGIEELDTPLPRWWLWVFYATILWSLGYWVLMPAWPLVSGYTAGLLGYSQRATVERQLQQARAAQAPYIKRINALPLAEILKDADLLAFALDGGQSAFAVNCSPCHGAGGAGRTGYPNLADDAWLWGGKPDDIARTIRFGIRTEHPETRVGAMPAFLGDGMLPSDQVDDVTQYVLRLSGQEHDAAAAARGRAVFAEQCALCHGKAGNGNPQLGAPSLADRIWLYGGSAEAIRRSIAMGRAGVMPAWAGRLDPAVIKQLAIYVHQLGGGE